MNYEGEIRGALRALDERGAASEALRVLRERLAGELVGDGDRVAATLAPDFELVGYTGGAATTSSGAAVADSVRGLGSIGALLWVLFDDLVVDGDAVAGHGRLRMYRPDQQAVVTTPIAIFISVAGGQMTREVLFMQATAAETVAVQPGDMPTVEQLRALVR